MPQAYSIIVTGKVQGVGFRRFVQELARQHSLVGNVSNLPDGSVRIFVQGDNSKIDAFIDSIRSLPEPVKVEGLKKTAASEDTALDYFRVIHGSLEGRVR